MRVLICALAAAICIAGALSQAAAAPASPPPGREDLSPPTALTREAVNAWVVGHGLDLPGWKVLGFTQNSVALTDKTATTAAQFDLPVRMEFFRPQKDEKGTLQSMLVHFGYDCRTRQHRIGLTTGYARNGLREKLPDEPSVIGPWEPIDPDSSVDAYAMELCKGL